MKLLLADFPTQILYMILIWYVPITFSCILFKLIISGDSDY